MGPRWASQARRRGCRRPGRQGPPSQALWGLVSWEAESAPSSEQKGDTGRPGARPHALPAQGLTVLGDPSPLPSPGPHSRKQPAFLSKAPRESRALDYRPGGLQRGGKQASTSAVPQRACSPSPPCHTCILGFWERQYVPSILLQCERRAVWGKIVHPRGIVSDRPGLVAMWLVLASWRGTECDRAVQGTQYGLIAPA